MNALSFFSWFVRSFLSLLVFFLCACSTQLPSQVHQYFESCNEEAAVEVIRSLQKKEKDVLLFDLALLSLGVHGGYESLVLKHGKQALSNMWTHGDKKRGNLSLFTSEAARDYKGEPFEKIMAGLYVGSVLFNQGDFENARAAFQKAVMASQTKSEKTINENVPLLHFLLAKTFLILGQKDNARVSLEKISKYSGFAQGLTLDSLSQIHTIVVGETGHAPQKNRSGPGQSLIEYRPLYSRFLGADFWDGQVYLGDSHMAEDMLVHAVETERFKREVIQVAKGVLRDAAIIAAAESAEEENEKVAAVSTILALGIQSQADIRQWELIPARLHVVWDMTPFRPGRRQYMLRFFENTSMRGNHTVARWSDERHSNAPKIYIKKARSCYK